jgi:hypothetical protein
VSCTKRRHEVLIKQVLKLGYKKIGKRGTDQEHVRFEVLERSPDELHYKKNKEVFILRESYSIGRVWDEYLDRLEVAARACAFFNNRKNVVDTRPEEGVLY